MQYYNLATAEYKLKVSLRHVRKQIHFGSEKQCCNPASVEYKLATVEDKEAKECYSLATAECNRKVSLDGCVPSSRLESLAP